MENTEGIKAPAVTICPRNPRYGWRDVMDMPHKDIIQHQCRESENELADCIESNTFNLSDIVRGATIGYKSRKPLTDPGLWSVDFEYVKYGRCYTLNYPENIGPDYMTDAIYLLLDLKLNHRIYVHDKNYFVPTSNPLSLPTVRIDILTNSSFNHYNMLTLTQLHELDVPSDPCEENTDYSFRACVKERLSKEVGSVLCSV